MTNLPERLFTGCEPFRFNDGFGDFSQDDVKWTNVFAENAGGESTTLGVNDVNAVFANCTTWMTAMDLGFYPGTFSESQKPFASDYGDVLFWWSNKGEAGRSKGKAFWPYKILRSTRPDSQKESYSHRTDYRAAAVAMKNRWSVDSVVPSGESERIIHQEYFMSEGACDNAVAPINGWCFLEVEATAYDKEEGDDVHDSRCVELWARVSSAKDIDENDMTGAGIDDDGGFKVLLYSDGRHRTAQFPVKAGYAVTLFSKYVGEEEFGFEKIDISVYIRKTELQ